jgi:chain length determinant protein EpsF
LLKKLDVKPARESSVVNISFTAVDPKFAAAIANAVAKAYIDTNLELKVEPARQTAQWFSERTRTLRQDVEGSASKLAEYQREKGIVSLDERLETENARLEQLNAQLSQAAAQTADAQTRQRLARDFTARGGAPDALPDVLANPLISNLKVTLSQQEGKLRELSSRLGTGHPQYQAAVAEVESARQRLRDEMGAVVKGIENNAQIAQRREVEIRAQVAAQKDRVLKLKRERDELSALMREAENAQKAFDVTTQRFTQTTLESQATQTNIAVLNPATEPLKPSFPKWPLNLALAVFLGTLLGVGVALLLEMLDQRIRSEADVAGTLQLPLLATLPVARLPVIARARRLMLPGRASTAR